MAKKWIAAMLVVCIALGTGVIYVREQSDREAPKIVCTDEAVAVYDPEMSDTELLKGIKATDNKDGDVSDSLTVESVYEVDDSDVVVTYVAKDDANNIAKLKRSISIDPQKKNDSSATQTDTEPTSVPVEDIEMGDEASVESGVQADETLTPTPVPDDPATQMALEQEQKADAMPAQSPRIYLNEYYMTVAVGGSVDFLSNVKEIKDDSDNISELWRRIQITGQVNTSAPGTYTCTYYVIDSAGNMSNSAELTVVVE